MSNTITAHGDTFTIPETADTTSKIVEAIRAQGGNARIITGGSIVIDPPQSITGATHFVGVDLGYDSDELVKATLLRKPDGTFLVEKIEKIERKS